jgi:hypothetical protein
MIDLTLKKTKIDADGSQVFDVILPTSDIDTGESTEDTIGTTRLAPDPRLAALNHHPDCKFHVWCWEYSWHETDCTCPPDPRICELEARLEWREDGLDGIYCRDETIRLLETSTEELEAENKSLVKFLTMDDVSHAMLTRIKELEAARKVELAGADELRSDVVKQASLIKWQYRKGKKLQAQIDRTQALVGEQAEDEGLWCDPQHIVEDILQHALRKLHAVIEDDQNALAALGEKE